MISVLNDSDASFLAGFGWKCNPYRHPDFQRAARSFPILLAILLVWLPSSFHVLSNCLASIRMIRPLKTEILGYFKIRY